MNAPEPYKPEIDEWASIVAFGEIVDRRAIKQCADMFMRLSQLERDVLISTLKKECKVKFNV